MNNTDHEYQCVALLPMKAHSARVPGKNFRKFAGKPLFRWILDTLLEAPQIELVVINTDARAILADHGLTSTERILIRDRRPEICGDMVSMNKVLADDVKSVSANTYVMTHTTNPLLSSATLRHALEKYQSVRADGSGDSLFTVNRLQSRFYRSDASAVNHDPSNLIRTQDLEPWFEENSHLYIFSGESFSRTSARIGTKPVLSETPRIESFDIDDEDGWKLAEIVAERRLSQ